jgi:four helix bundle protein
VAGAKKFEELICWQLACELRQRIYRILSNPVVARDRDFCVQIRKSSRSAPALIAEGFGRWTNQEFVRYLRLAVGELGETRNHLGDGAECGHIEIDELRALWRLQYRATRACSGLINSLERRIAESEAKKKKRRRRPPRT